VSKIALTLRQHYDYRSLLNAYLDCRQVKRNKKSAIAFETRFERNLYDLMNQINDGSYKIGRSEVFVVTKPKAREVWAAQFRDRIVHHLVHNDISAYIDRRFIEDTFSCISGRGNLSASDRLMQFHRRATNNYDTDCYALQFDIKNFFVSIDKTILWHQLERIVGAKESSLTAKLLHQIIWNDPTENPIIKPNSNFSLVPSHKSLWSGSGKKGLPIGNLTSQTASNVYLNGFDHFVKHALKAKYYVRYVDDAVILSKNKDYLYECLDAISAYLSVNLGLEIHPDKCSIFPASQGANFVGFIHKPWRRYPRNSMVSSAKHVARNGVKKGECFVSSINSYLGIMKNSNSYSLRKSICIDAVVPSIFTCNRNFTKIIKL